MEKIRRRKATDGLESIECRWVFSTDVQLP